MTVEINKDPWPQEPVELLIEKVNQFRQRDDAFFTEMRVLTGPQKGEVKSNLWFRKKSNGEPRKDTAALLTSLCGNHEAPEKDLVDKAFATEPWYPENSKYPIFTKIKKIEVEPW